MPASSSVVTITASGQAEHVQLLENGLLESVYFMPEDRGTGMAESYAEVYIAVTDTPAPIPVAFLASGVLGANTGIGWTGAINMEPAFALMVRVWSIQNWTYRLNWITTGVE